MYSKVLRISYYGTFVASPLYPSRHWQIYGACFIYSYIILYIYDSCIDKPAECADARDASLQSGPLTFPSDSGVWIIHIFSDLQHQARDF